MEPRFVPANTNMGVPCIRDVKECRVCAIFIRSQEVGKGGGAVAMARVCCDALNAAVSKNKGGVTPPKSND